MKVSRKSALIVIIAVALLAVVAGIYTANYLKKGEYEDVTVQETADLIDKTPDLVILDVRTISEYNDGHIEGASNIPVDDLENRLDELDKEDKILVYCKTGNRSTTAVELLEEAGFLNLYHMYEGISEWREQDYSVVQ